jgi:protein-S-isoprenylcysteine O-methyltransferase Ste14
MATTLLAYLLTILFLVTEGRLRQSSEARSLDATEPDRGSTRLIGVFFGLACGALLLAPLLNLIPLGRVRHPTLTGWVGIAIMLAGIALRVWANRVLGAYYTRTLRIVQEQRVVEEGPYRLVRHPGYLGIMLMWVGAALATVNGITGLVIVVGVLVVYGHRIRSEETMLIQAFGDQYRAYEAHTWRLIPFVL